MARILVVDDDEMVLAVVTRLLKLHGHVADTAIDGGQAVDLLQKSRYDLMIIDRQMPELNGIDAVAIIRSSAKFRDLKILMFTHSSLTKEVDEAYEAGVDGYIVKPIDLGRLIGKIEEALGKAP